MRPEDWTHPGDCLERSLAVVRLHGAMSDWPGLAQALEVDEPGVKAVLDAGKSLGLDAQELAWVIERESGWIPEARNPTSDARGLLQWLPSTRRQLGIPDNPGTRSEQARHVTSFFKAIGKPIPKGDVYVAVFAPAYVGRRAGTIIASVGSKAWQANPSLRESPTGPITVDSVRRVGTPPTGDAKVPKRPKPSQSAVPPWALVVVALLAVDSLRRPWRAH